MIPSNALIFLQTKGTYFSDNQADFLYFKAVELAISQNRRLCCKISSEDSFPIGEIVIETDYRYAVLGALGGIVFSIRVIIESKEASAEFIINEKCLTGMRPAGHWVAIPDSEPTPSSSLN